MNSSIKGGHHLNIKSTEVSDAPLIHHLMIQAFTKHKDAVPPSSALEETVESIAVSLHQGEKGLLAYVDDRPVGMVRFQLDDNGIYFYRLSVLPEEQGKGIGKALLDKLEHIANHNGVTTISCKVRLSANDNITLYESVGYEIVAEEIISKPGGINLRVVSMEKKCS